jgi:hypothetical protein
MTRMSNAVSEATTMLGVDPANLSDQTVHAELAPAALQAFVGISKRWNLNDRQSCSLLGGVSPR